MPDGLDNARRSRCRRGLSSSANLVVVPSAYTPEIPRTASVLFSSFWSGVNNISVLRSVPTSPSSTTSTTSLTVATRVQRRYRVYCTGIKTKKGRSSRITHFAHAAFTIQSFPLVVAVYPSVGIGSDVVSIAWLVCMLPMGSTLAITIAQHT